MGFAEWTLLCIGLSDNGNYLDELQETWGVNVLTHEKNMLELIRMFIGNLGNAIARRIFEAVVEKAVKKYDLNRNDFDAWFNGSLDTHFYYKSQEIFSWEDLEELL